MGIVINFSNAFLCSQAKIEEVDSRIVAISANLQKMNVELNSTNEIK
jgi:hypothetical protein